MVAMCRTACVVARVRIFGPLNPPQRGCRGDALALPIPTDSTQLHADWAGARGVWWRARTDPAQAALVLRSVEGDLISRARADADQLRVDMREVTTFDAVTLDRWTTTFPLKPKGWDGDPIGTWRAVTMGYFIEALLKKDGRQSLAPREWLASLVDLDSMQADLPSFARLLLYETDPTRLSRGRPQSGPAHRERGQLLKP